ncbi:ERF family protein [Sinorhizobium meliloti]|uniref:ERF family protein n=1 Tax=Rhizobium meliloti TaxID=382 RepID=UPI000FDA9090|nr:ERF family protein [Sinorhizobium meliloti]RVH21469.1 ERF family protein [Sinorhizobium meliloti]RVH21530.1 ERF family protein [Sinorhizobium meliloti]
MSAVVKHEQAPAPVPAVSESAAIIQVIERAAMNPNVDIDKMERLLQMQERIMERQAKASYMAALAEMQPDLPSVPERGQGHGNIKYALWEDINDLIKPVLGKHGFSLSFRTGQADGKIIVTGVLSHRDGHSEETTMHLPTDTSGSKNAVQAVGSSTSYGKRYVAQALLNLTSRGEDDNGVASGGKVITAEQRQELQNLIEAAGGDVATFCEWAKIESLAALPASLFAKAKQALEAKARQKGAAK